MTVPLRIVFAGTPQFSVPALDALHAAGHSIVAVYTQPDRPAGRGRGLTASALKQRALELGLPVEQPVSLKDRAVQSRLASHAPDLMVVVAYGLLLPQAVLDIPSLGCLNIHASLLPRWRGAAPIQRAVLAGDDVSGVTIMKMDAGLDTGPSLLQREVALDARETGGSLHDKLGPLGAHAVVDAVAGWAAGTLEAHPQPAHGVTYAAKLTKAEARIDWTSLGARNRSPGSRFRSVARRGDDARRGAGTHLGSETGPDRGVGHASAGGRSPTARAVAGRYRRRHARIAETAIARP